MWAMAVCSASFQITTLFDESKGLRPPPTSASTLLRSHIATCRTPPTSGHTEREEDTDREDRVGEEGGARARTESAVWWRCDSVVCVCVCVCVSEGGLTTAAELLDRLRVPYCVSVLGAQCETSLILVPGYREHPGPGSRCCRRVCHHAAASLPRGGGGGGGRQTDAPRQVGSRRSGIADESGLSSSPAFPRPSTMGWGTQRWASRAVWWWCGVQGSFPFQIKMFTTILL